jgi:hypothetical protein
MIQFCTTAMPRPDIVEKTYSSFSKNLKGIDLKEAELFINIDPVSSGDVTKDVAATLHIATKYFGQVTANLPQTPNFTAAVDWCWSNASSEYILHLEDDWELRAEVAVPQVLETMKSKDFMQAIFRAYPRPYKKLALSPGIMHRDYYSRFAGDFDHSKNPEIQLRKSFVKRDKIMVVGKKPIVVDLGRPWLKGEPFKKPDVKSDFVKWEGWT